MSNWRVNDPTYHVHIILLLYQMGGEFRFLHKKLGSILVRLIFFQKAHGIPYT